MAEPITAGLHTLTVGVHAPYATELVRAEMVDRYGPRAYTAGYRVYPPWIHVCSATPGSAASTAT